MVDTATRRDAELVKEACQGMSHRCATQPATARREQLAELQATTGLYRAADSGGGVNR
jgi:hypothetical protein